MKILNANILWTSKEAEAVTGGQSSCEWAAMGISMNMESLKPGDLYIATREDDLDLVFQKGAAAAVISSRNTYSGDYPVLRVGAVFEALQDLAKAARFKTHAYIVAVQGRDARMELQNTLKNVGRVHEGGRHLSLGLAALPENIDFGVFGFSPFLQPDITVISHFGSRQYEMVLEGMPVHGTLIVNCDDPAHVDVIARAKACGVLNIITYGASEHADARIINTLKASNGARVYMRIFNEDKVFTLPAAAAFSPHALISLLVLKLTDRPTAVEAIAQPHSLTTPTAELVPSQQGLRYVKFNETSSEGLTLFEAGRESAMPPQAVFRITNMIDLGMGRQTAILDNLANFSQKTLCFPEKNLAIPRSLDTLDLMYTGKTVGAVKDAQEAIQNNFKTKRLEEIAPEALAPGDFVVFKDIREKSRAVFSNALRLINPKKLSPIDAV